MLKKQRKEDGCAQTRSPDAEEVEIFSASSEVAEGGPQNKHNKKEQH